MRNRRQARHNSDTTNAFHIPATPVRAEVPFERIFAPSDLDLDNLVEAIRVLLEHDGGAPHLLSLPTRGTHVVEANGAT